MIWISIWKQNLAKQTFNILFTIRKQSADHISFNNLKTNEKADCVFFVQRSRTQMAKLKMNTCGRYVEVFPETIITVEWGRTGKKG